MMIGVGEDPVIADQTLAANAELSGFETPTEHAYAWALDGGDDDLDTVRAYRYGWRPVMLRAAGVLAVLLAGAAAIVALWWTSSRNSAPPRAVTPAPSASANPAPSPLPAPTVTITEAAPPPPVQSAPVHGNSPGADRRYLALLSQIPDMTITDPTLLVESGPRICTYLDSHGREKTAALVEAKDGGLAPSQAVQLIDATITVYCPLLQAGE